MHAFVIEGIPEMYSSRSNAPTAWPGLNGAAMATGTRTPA